MSDTWALLKRLCRIETGPDRSGRLSRRAPSTDLMAFFFAQIGISRLFLSHFPKGHKVQALDVSRLPQHAWIHLLPAPLYDCRIFPSHFPVSEGETLLPLGDCLFPDFISSTSSIVDGHPNDAMVFLRCAPQNQNSWLQDGRLEPQTSGCNKKTVPPFSRATGHSWDLHQAAFRTKSGSFRLIQSPVLNACCTSPNCSLCPWLHTDCRHGLQDCHKTLPNKSETVILCPGGLGSVKPLIMSLALARRPDGLLSSGSQVRAQRVSIARSGQREWPCAVSSRDSTLAPWFLSRVCHSTSMLFRNSCLSAGDNWVIFTSLRCRTCRAPGETVKKASSVISLDCFRHYLLSPQTMEHRQRSHHISGIESNVSGHGTKTSS